MAQILLIEKDESLRMILKLNAIKILGVDVIEKDSSTDAVSFIQILPNLDLIICNQTLPDYSEIIDHLVSEKLSIPLLWQGESVPNYKNTKMLSSNTSWETLLVEGGKILGIDTTKKSESSEGFEAVSCIYFLNITSTSLGCDVYLKLKKEGKDHFIKCLHSTDKFTRNDIEKYMKQGLKEFYIPKSHFVQFVNFVTNTLVQRLESPILKGEVRVAVTGESYKISMERIQSLGIDEFTVSLVEANVKSMMTSVGETNALGNFLKTMRENPQSYAYANAYLTGLISQKIIEKFEWSSLVMKAKLSYVAYFHNISLKNEDFMKIKTMEELKAADLQKSEDEMILNHAHLSASIVEKFPMVPEGVGTIIKEHHGAKNGVGFPESLSISITPLSMMFLVVEDFVDEFLKVSEKPTKDDFERIFTKLNTRYTKLTYAQALNALIDMIYKKNS